MLATLIEVDWTIHQGGTPNLPALLHWRRQQPRLNTSPSANYSLIHLTSIQQGSSVSQADSLMSALHYVAVRTFLKL